MLSQFEGNFHINRSLGVGATSEVFEAFNKASGQKVALKAFANIVLSDDEVIARIQDETQALQAINHPNVVRLIAQHRDSKSFGLELEFVEGSHLATWLKSYDVALIEPKLWVLAQIARGLGAAHEQGILHRDLKPENVLVSENGEVKITDFGLARSINRMTMTKLGLLVGSLGYMAPELVSGKKASEQSDIFSLGAIAFEVITGRAAFSGDSPQEVIRNIADVRRPNFDNYSYLPREVACIIERCLSVDPNDRPATVWEVEAALMGSILKSGLAPLSRRLVSNQRISILREALEAKHQRLIAEASLGADLVRVIAELQRLFPEEQKIEELLASMRADEKPPRRRRFLVLWVLLLFLVGVPAINYWWQSRKVEEVTATSVDTAPIQEPTKPIAVVRSSAYEPGFGGVRFKVDPDVKVYLNDVLVPQSMWRNLVSRVGTHRVKLVKDGFMPLESFVKVSEGRLSVVNAQSGGN